MPEKLNSKIIVGMSGGVDSAVAALLLQEQGYDVQGLFMDNWEDDTEETYCNAAEDFQDARQVCEELEVPLHKVNFAKEYRDRVFSYFLQEYEAGRTPNPDILCNSEIKFKVFLEYAMRLGADCIATGHYARVRNAADGPQLLKGADRNKDQSYFLHAVNRDALAKTLFPLGELEKSAVRRLATEAGFDNYAKRDSTGICFIGERKFREFLSKYLPAQPGEMRSPDGELIGEHQGLMYYTIGQRQGLGIGGRRDASNEPWYVVGKDLGNNVLTVAQGHDHPAMQSAGLIAKNLHWINTRPASGARLHAKTRYRQADQACELVELDENACTVKFADVQRAVTPGQYVVFYKDAECLGGGVIDRALSARQTTERRDLRNVG